MQMSPRAGDIVNAPFLEPFDDKRTLEHSPKVRRIEVRMRYPALVAIGRRERAGSDLLARSKTRIARRSKGCEQRRARIEKRCDSYQRICDLGWAPVQQRMRAQSGGKALVLREIGVAAGRGYLETRMR